MYELNNNDSDSVPQDKVLVLKSLVCNSTLAGENNPDHVLLKVQGDIVWEWSSDMYATKTALLSGSVNFDDIAFIEIDIGSTKIGPYAVSNNRDSPQRFQEGKADYILLYQVKP
ncbi:hypothetical protein [Nostoc sp. LPT]|uniref:hypothetical protein n=1 Tax=Nostoc sp. LPT TaxID=2815387 RepID=UPI001DCB8D4F|nr:hypothetical protein [Nostoc sp. LPT]MBN4006703.1 hypothetical protein [Nostoc sp. LPT]